MNERIELLAKQASSYAWQMAGDSYHGVSEVSHNQMYEWRMQKFAELIVKECIDQVAGTKIVGQLSGDEFAGLTESADNKYTQWNNALVIATMNVRDHFGVKE